jgi:hypothetical protein
MAAFEWSWTFFLNKTFDGRFTVSAKQTVRAESAMRIPARRGLRDGIDVYEALYAIVEEAGYHLPDHDLEEISRNIAEVDRALVSDFVNGAELSERQRHFNVCNGSGHYCIPCAFEFRLSSPDGHHMAFLENRSRKHSPDWQSGVCVCNCRGYQYFNSNHLRLSSSGVTTGYLDQVFVRIKDGNAQRFIALDCSDDPSQHRQRQMRNLQIARSLAP